MNAREASIISPAQRRRMEVAPDENRRSVGAQLTSAGKGIAGAAKDIARGVIELPAQVVGGFGDAIKEAADLLTDVFGLPPEKQLIDIKDPASVTGNLIRKTSQFLTGFTTALKATQAIGLGKIVGSMVAGAVADATVFDPQEERLSNLIQEFPALQNPVTAFLEADPGDSDALGRFKAALEGLGLGVVAEGFIVSAKVLRQARIVKREQAKVEADQQIVEKVADIKEEKFVPFTEKLGDPKQPAFKIGKETAPEEAALNINLSRLNTTEDVEKLIENVAKSDAVKINKARRQQITLDETSQLADELGLTVDQLLTRRRGQAFNAEQAVAARKILVASGENIISLAKTASTGSEADLAIFKRAMAQHQAIQEQVSGLTAEAGRALGSFRIVAESASAQNRAIREALESAGGADTVRFIADGVAQLEHAGQINQFVRLSAGKKTKDAIYEAWINGLLSSPATHTVNVLGNSMTIGWAVGERKVASWIGRALGDQNIPDGEVAAQLKGMVEGAKDGMRLSWKALKTGVPSDPIQKIETIGRRSISAEALELSGTAGKFADYLGETVRVPGRLLTASDELFKAIGYRMELNAQAYKTAYNEGLRGDQLALRMDNIIKNPPENLHLFAIDAGRYQTFTKPLGEAGQAIQKAVTRIPGARVIVPFMRTPTNIIKYVGERTVLAPLAKGVREEIAAGGARRDMALAKIATGTMIMAASADYTLSGQITGAGPTNSAMRNILRETGWQPYSIRVGDTFMAYNRLDPIGATVGIAADIAEIIGQTGEFDALDLATASVASVAQNVTSKTYLSGVSQLFEVLASASSDPGKNNRNAQRWIERLAGSVIPAGIAQLERTLNPELSATQGIIEKIKSRIPGYSDDLPPRRNIFGEPIILSGGLGPDIMSPLYTSEVKINPVAEEIVQQQSLIRMPLKNINGIELDTRQYDEYILLYSGKNNRFVQMPLKQKLATLFRSPQYQIATEGQEGGKSVLIRATFEAYRESAKAAMIENHPDLQMSIMKLKTKKAEKLIGIR